MGGAQDFAAIRLDNAPDGLLQRCGISHQHTGGNIDRRMLSTVLLRGLAHDGKIARLRIEIEDVPGVLARVTRLIGDTGADIIDITHERTFTKQPPRCAELDVTCETRGRAHVEALLALLHGQGFRAQLL